MSKRICAIIQARMRSTRLPGKILLTLDEKPVLQNVIEQTKHSKLIKNIIVATTDSIQDEPIVNFCKKMKYKYFRGSEKDVLDRYYKCAKKFKCDPIVRITSDCPFVDPKTIDIIVSKFLNGSYDYVANNLDKINGKWDNSTCNFPQGMTVEISSFKALQRAWKEAKKPSEREHVFPYVQFNPQLFRVTNVKNRTDYSHVRCTIDHSEDLIFLKEICVRLPKKRHYVKTKDIVKIIKKEPNLLKINSKIPFDEGYKKSISQDKKQGYK